MEHIKKTFSTIWNLSKMYKVLYYSNINFSTALSLNLELWIWMLCRNHKKNDELQIDLIVTLLEGVPR